MSSDKAKQDIIDRFLIREQVDRYMDALNHRDWDAIGETMCDEIIWSASEPFNLRYETKPAFVEMLKTVQTYQFGFVFQMGHGIVVREISGNTAKVCHTLEIFGNSFHCVGLYYDEMRKEADSVWRFLRRDYRPTYYDARNVPGKIYRQLPDPNYHNLPDA